MKISQDSGVRQSFWLESPFTAAAQSHPTPLAPAMLARHRAAAASQRYLAS